MKEEEISIFPEYTITYATFKQRLGAAILDYLILIIPNYLISDIVGGKNIVDEIINNNVQMSSIVGLLLQTLLSLLYFAFMESSKARATVGKQALNIQVVTISEEQVSFARAFGRNFGKNLSFLLILLGYFMMLWDHRNQTLHDKMAGTLVINKKPEQVI